jgi:hypothetical protein
MNKNEKNFRYQHKELEAHIEEQNDRIFDLVTEEATQLAEINKPIPTGDHLGHYLGNIRGEYNKLPAYSDSVVQSDMNAEQTLNKQKVIDEKVKSVEEERKNTAETIRTKRIQRDRIGDYGNSRTILYVWLSIILIASAETWFTAKSFQLIGGGFLTTLLMTFGIGAVLVAIAHIVPRLIRWGKTKSTRFIIGTVCLAVVGAFFYILGEFRVSYLTQNAGFNAFGDEVNEPVSTGLSPWRFMFINLVFISISSLISLIYLPSNEQQAQRRKWKALESEIRKLEVFKTDLGKSLDSLKEEGNQLQTRRTAVLLYSKYIENWIDSLYQQAVSQFRKENIILRHDGVIPDCFQESAPALTFFHIKNSKK